MAKQENLQTKKTSIHDIFDDTLELILLRVSSPVVLIRAVATCKLWRQVIRNAAFLRCFRRRNGPYVLGCHLYDNHGHCKDFVPFPVPAKEIGIGDRVSLSFLPTYEMLHDSRDGLLAFSHGDTIVVCNPWTRKRSEFLFPTTPAAEGMFETHQEILGTFFLDADTDETDTGMGLNMSNFRILCVQLCRCYIDGTKTVQARVFSARDNLWLELGTMADISDSIPVPGIAPFCFVGRVSGSICWSYTRVDNNAVLLHLDESTGEFSCFTLPAAGVNRHPLCYNRSRLRLIGGNTGFVRLLRIAGNDLEVLCHDRSGEACVVERRVPLFGIAGDKHEVMLCRRQDRSVAARVLDLESRPRFSPVPSNEYDARSRQWCFSDDTSDEAAAPGRVILCDKQCDLEYVLMFSVQTHNIDFQRVRKLSTHSDRRAFPYELPWTISACL